MKIVLSGGWGYGNLGDDAILSSTLAILKDLYPNANFDILTYDILDSAEHLSRGIKLHRSAHSYIDLGSSKIKYKRFDKNYSFIKKLKLKLNQKIVESSFFHNNFVYSHLVSKLNSVVKGADLFIMCGGGYFNEKWLSNVHSHLYELQLAANYKIPYYVAGPTLGLFTSRALNRKVKNALVAAKDIYVRDDSSFENLSRQGIQSKLIPDVALTRFYPKLLNKSPRIKLGIVYNNSTRDFCDYFINEIERYLIKYPITEINFILTRKWDKDYKACQYIIDGLSSYSRKSNMIVPTTHLELEKEIRSVDLLISENLHGLILASRNGLPIVAINDYPKNSPNHRKIEAFMNQVNCSNLVIDSSSTENLLVEKIENSISNANLMPEEMKFFINENHKKTLDFFLKSSGA